MFRILRSAFRGLFSREFWRLVRDYPFIVMAGIEMATEPPVRFRKLDLRPKGVTPWHDGSRVAIECDYRVSRDHRADCRVAVDLRKDRIDWTYTDGWMFNRVHDEGAIGIALFSLPVLVVLSPVLKRIAARRGHMEEARGMSRHGTALVDRLREAGLDDATLGLLTTALKNEYAWEKKYRRHVDFAEAKGILSASDLTVIRYDPSEDRPHREKLRAYYWRDDDGEIVAEAQIVDDGLHYMTVLGDVSWIEDLTEEECMALLDCHRSREEIDIEEARKREAALAADE